jgi:DNA-binding beta-propeller fold protein YncE
MIKHLTERPGIGMVGLLLFFGLITVSCSTEKNEQILLAVVEKGNGSLGFYTPSGERLAGVELDSFPHEMVFSPEREFAYVTNNGSLRYADSVEGGETVSVINLQTLEKEGDILLAPFRRPHGIDLDPVTGYLAVSVENPDRVLLIDPGKRSITDTFDNRGSTPHMVTLSSGAEWIYVSNVGSANVVGIERKARQSFSIDVGDKPQKMVLSPDEKILYVACDECISVLDIGQRKEIARIPNGSNRMDLVDEGNLLVFASNRFGVGFADAIRYTMIHHIDIPYKPYSLHVTADEKYAFVAAEEQDIVYTVSIADRVIVDSFRTSPGFRPDPLMEFRIDRKVLPKI